MAKELYATSHWKSLQEEQLTITDLLSTVLFHPRLYTMGELQNCFTRWSLSSSAIQLQTKAKLLNSTLLRQMNTSSKESLASFTHHFSSLMHSDSSILVLSTSLAYRIGYCRYLFCSYLYSRFVCQVLRIHRCWLSSQREFSPLLSMEAIGDVYPQSDMECLECSSSLYVGTQR